ncbi:hypothetical protein [Parabacteroides sp. PF5-9]|uniref:hypothetical protein n=1 Tax=Parabacteroides sp. PF5-9 TaxID=1742404 RepID=UPI0024732697|nr:hypothetical protein [Parabacteroides sp. PF5-9]MDH6358383.1 hypothetical protein [Parabacteroides sp. PF5-9]
MKTKERKNWFFYSTAQNAVYLLVLALFPLLCLSTACSSGKEYDALYETWYEHFPNNYMNTSTYEPYSFHAKRDSLTLLQRKTLLHSLSAYDDEFYSLAHEGFLKVLDEEQMKEQPEIFFFYTLNLQEMNSFQKVIENFNYLLQASISDFPYYDELRWKLALSYLKTRDKKNAVRLLNELKSSPQYSYQTKAEALLQEL